MLYLVATLVHLAAAQSVPFHNLTPEDYRAVAREFTANALYSRVGGAGTLGTPFSFEVGVTAGLTTTPHIDELTKDASVPRIPTGFVYGALALPLALTAEVGWWPGLSGGGYRFTNLGFALAWTPTELFFSVPFDLGVRAQFVRTGLNLEALVDEVRTRANFDGRVSAVELRVSKNLGILTPTISLGVGQGHATMNASGAAVFDPAYTGDQRAATYVRGPLFGAGVELHLLLFVAGVEFLRAFGADRVNAKLGFGF